jgi:hypothetical protein
VCIRPEDLEVDPAGPLRGAVVRSTYLGNRVDYLIQIGSLSVRVEGRTGPTVPAGERIALRVRRAIAYADIISDTTSSGPASTQSG